MKTAPIILDIEASGFGRSSYPIELGYTLPDGQTWCSLIRPEPDWTHWDNSAQAVHHISQDLLLSRGRYVREVASLLNQNLGGQIAYSDGWGHDYSGQHDTQFQTGQPAHFAERRRSRLMARR
jgi:hypothetical protein